MTIVAAFSLLVWLILIGNEVRELHRRVRAIRAKRCALVEAQVRVMIENCLGGKSFPTRAQLHDCCNRLTARLSCHDVRCIGFAKHPCHDLNCSDHALNAKRTLSRGQQ